MELVAVIRGLEALKEPVEVEVITDSKYVMDAFVKGWIVGWKKKGWKSSTGDVKNQDLWLVLDKLVEHHNVSWRWVKGHSGDPDNDRVDALAVAESHKF